MDRNADPQAGHFTHAIETDALQKLRALQGRLIAAPRVADKAVAAATLDGVLVQRLGAFEASGPPTSPPGQSPGSPTRMRSYAASERTAELRISDTGTDPQRREWLLRRLLLEGDDYLGDCEGELVGQHPAIVSFFKVSRSSWVQVLVDDRFIVDLRVKAVDERDAARELFTQLDLSSLPTTTR